MCDQILDSYSARLGILSDTIILHKVGRILSDSPGTYHVMPFRSGSPSLTVSQLEIAFPLGVALHAASATSS
ncbi:hypothetical protein HID58_061530 [Brassica napus]|uniref:Uncharacterized protein n=1 Tax=Brassica napus TaxID=3708 RepID=A0ABQ7ZYU7_BRANA|nr:hypothetical protein HID58_061530 [Brassica napus]